MKTALLSLALLLCASTAHASAPVIPYSGARTVVKAEHLIPQMRGGEGYGEKYTFNADFGDRGSLYFSLTLSSLGVGDNKMDARGRLTIDGKEFKYKKSLDEDDWKFEKGRLYIKAGPAILEGTPDRLVLKASQGSERFEAVFTPVARPWRPLNGRVAFGSAKKVSDYTVFPYGKVDVTYDLGEGEKTASGFGFGSHTWSDLAPYEQARWTLEFRGIDGDATIYIREIGTGGDYEKKRVAYLLVTKGSKILVESFNYQLDPTDLFTDEKHPNKYRVPESFTIMGQDMESADVAFRGKMTKKKLRKRKDMLTSLNAAVRLVASRYAKPMSYDYDTDFVVEVKGPAGVQRFSGTGRYEVYHWNL